MKTNNIFYHFKYRQASMIEENSLHDEYENSEPVFLGRNSINFEKEILLDTYRAFNLILSHEIWEEIPSGSLINRTI